MRALALPSLLLVACRPAASTAAQPPAEPAAPTTASGPSEPTSTNAPPPSTTAETKEQLLRAAREHFQRSECRKLVTREQGLVEPIELTFRVAPTGEVAEIVGVKHPASRKALADCYAAELKAHRFARTGDGAPIDVELEVPFGSMDKDIIRRVVRGNIEDVRRCYNAGLERDAELKGRVTITFTIGASGAVARAVVDKSELKDPTVATCIAEAAARWTFPAPEGGGNVVVTYPFVLEAG